MPPSLLSCQPMVNRYLKNIPSPLAAYAFANIFIWQDFFEFECVGIGDHLCIFAGNAVGDFLYLPPLAPKIDPAVIATCFQRMKEHNKNSGITRIENVSQGLLGAFAGDRYVVNKRGYEYLYYRADLADFKGDAFKSKRHAVNYFIKNYVSQYCPFEPSMAKECLALYDRWAQLKAPGFRDEIHLAMLDDNRRVLQRALEFYHELELVGRVLLVDGRIAAYTFGYFLNDLTFCDLFEIGDPQFKGAPTYIFWRLCCDDVLGRCRFINVMDDFAPDNVNATKMSFRPAVLLPVYTVTQA